MNAMALIHIEDVFVAYGSPSRAVLAGIDLGPDAMFMPHFRRATAAVQPR